MQHLAAPCIEFTEHVTLVCRTHLPYMIAGITGVFAIRVRFPPQPLETYEGRSSSCSEAALLCARVCVFLVQPERSG